MMLKPGQPTCEPNSSMLPDPQAMHQDHTDTRLKTRSSASHIHIQMAESGCKRHTRRASCISGGICAVDPVEVSVKYRLRGLGPTHSSSDPSPWRSCACRCSSISSFGSWRYAAVSVGTTPTSTPAASSPSSRVDAIASRTIPIAASRVRSSS
jgi:hypothetical protein